VKRTTSHYAKQTHLLEDGELRNLGRTNQPLLCKKVLPTCIYRVLKLAESGSGIYLGFFTIFYCSF